VLDAEKKQHKIRLAGIDAPERNQLFGVKAKQSLSDMVYGKEVTVEWKKRHRSRLIGKVWVQPSDCATCGETLDVSYAQISTGMAWWSRAFARAQSAEDQGRYESAEDEARLRKWGLWADSVPMPPWEWRKTKH
jgi:endonuclease YncB( thermonuclease family)